MFITSKFLSYFYSLLEALGFFCIDVEDLPTRWLEITLSLSSWSKQWPYQSRFTQRSRTSGRSFCSCEAGYTISVRLLFLHLMLEFEVHRAGSQKGEITGMPVPTPVTWNPLTVNWNLRPCFWPCWYQGVPARAPCHRTEHTDLALEEPDGSGSVAGPVASCHQGESADQQQCPWATKWHGVVFMLFLVSIAHAASHLAAVC